MRCLGSSSSRLRDLQREVHGVPTEAFDSGKLDLVTCCGSQDGLSKTLEMALNAGDCVAVEDHTFFATLSLCDPYGARYLVVETDEQGMKPDSLWHNLRQRHPAGRNDPARPKVLYANPTGANPSGTVLPAERKREIYDICSEYDILILEDDPYYFMQFSDRREASFLSMDRDCRVIR